MPATPHRFVLTLTAIGLLLPACSTTAQNGVVATDMGASLSQLWGGSQNIGQNIGKPIRERFSIAQHSDMVSGALRPSVHPEMQFMSAPKHSSDASLNTGLLSARLAEQNRGSNNRPSYRPQIPFTSQAVQSQAPYNRALTKTTKPKAFKATAYNAPIPPRATIKQNLKSTGRIGKPYVAPLPPQTVAVQPNIKKQALLNWEAGNKNINKDINKDVGGDSLSYVKIGGGSKIADWQACEKRAGGYYLARAGAVVIDPKFDSCMRAAGYKPEAEAEAELRQKASEKIPTTRRYPAP